MPSARVTFAIGLTASVAIHGLLWWKLPRDSGRPGRERPRAGVATVTIVPASPAKPKQIFGEAKGVGVAINASPGVLPQASPRPFVDQSAFTREPAGRGPAAEPPGPLARPVTAPPPAAVPTPTPSPLLAFHKPTRPAPPPPEPGDTASSEQPAAKPPAPAGGTPLPHSDRDSDPFAKQWSAEFRRGEVVARDGRQLKLVRPKINLAAVVQAAEITFPATTRFRIRIDDTGHVRKATIVASCGSASIDRAFLLSVYDSDSWFEPTKDNAGHSIGDEFEFGYTIPR